MVAFFRRSVEKNVNKAYFLNFFIFASQHRLGSSICKKIWFSHSFLSNLSYLKVSKRFKIFEKFTPSGRRWAPSGRGGRATPAPPRGRIFQNFRIALKLSELINSIKMSKKTIFFVHRWAWSVLSGHIMSKIEEKALLKKIRCTFVEVLSFPEITYKPRNDHMNISKARFSKNVFREKRVFVSGLFTHVN